MSFSPTTRNTFQIHSRGTNTLFWGRCLAVGKRIFSYQAMQKNPSLSLPPLFILLMFLHINISSLHYVCAFLSLIVSVYTSLSIYMISRVPLSSSLQSLENCKWSSFWKNYLLVLCTFCRVGEKVEKTDCFGWKNFLQCHKILVDVDSDSLPHGGISSPKLNWNVKEFYFANFIFNLWLGATLLKASLIIFSPTKSHFLIVKRVEKNDIQRNTCDMSFSDFSRQS